MADHSMLIVHIRVRLFRPFRMSSSLGSMLSYVSPMGTQWSNDTSSSVTEGSVVEREREFAAALCVSSGELI